MEIAINSELKKKWRDCETNWTTGMMRVRHVLYSVLAPLVSNF